MGRGVGVLAVGLLSLLCAGIAEARPRVPSPEGFGPLAVHVTKVSWPTSRI